MTRLQAIMLNPAVADTTLNIPFPYPDDAAAQWISTHHEAWHAGDGGPWAIVERRSTMVIGSIAMMVHAWHQRAELGYWLSVDHWNHGYMSEAGRAIVAFGFEHVGLNRVFAMHFGRNPASGRVMQNMGMIYEGMLRQHLQKNGRFEDCALYGVLREDWLVQGKKD